MSYNLYYVKLYYLQIKEFNVLLLEYMFLFILIIMR